MWSLKSSSARDEVAAVEPHDPRVVGVLDGQHRGQFVELEVVLAVKPHVGGHALELLGLEFGRYGVRFEEPPREPEECAVVAAAGVEFGHGDQGRHVGRVDAQGRIELLHGQRIAALHAVELAQDHAVLDLVGCRRHEGFGFGDRLVVLPRGHQQPSFGGREGRDAAEPQLRGVEHGNGRERELRLLVERR